MLPFELFIGGRYLRARQKQTFISLITLLSIAGVTVGVMALIVVIAVMAGFEADLKARILGVESHVVIMHHGGKFSNYEEVVQFVEGVEGVVAATPFTYSQVMLRSPTGVSGAVLRGIIPQSAGRVIRNLNGQGLMGSAHAEPTVNGRNAAPGIILGKELAKNLRVGKGDRIHLISPRGMLSPIGHLPAMKQFIVADLFESGMYEFDGSLAFVEMQSAQKLMRMGDAATGVEVRVDDIDRAGDVAGRISQKLEFPFWTRDWTQMNRNLFSALKLEKKVMFIILALIILVAAFNIASSLIMMVMQKTRDIAILKTMGATDRSIKRIFVFKGMVIGVMGTAIGVCLGLLICVLLKHYSFIELPGDIYYITTLPVKLKMLDVVTIAVSALAICFIATLYPAHQASRLDPVEAIRYG